MDFSLEIMMVTFPRHPSLYFYLLSVKSSVFIFLPRPIVCMTSNLN